MKLKSVLSMLLCALLVFTPVFAESESDSMQKALAYAKTILSVPEEYTEFTYRSQAEPDGEVSWIFIWSGENKGDMQVYLSDDGFVSAYYSWIYEDSNPETLATYTHDEAREIAKEFIQKVNPEIYPYLWEVTPDGERRNSDTASFIFQEFYGEIPVFANTVSVTVDKYHGNIRSYHGTRKTEGIPETTSVLTEEEAKEAYLRDIGVQLEYRTYYNYQDKSYTVFPVYHLKDVSGKAIDAISGEVKEPYFPDSQYRYTVNSSTADSAMKEESVAAGGVQFTPEELEALKNVSEVYSKEEALKLVTEKIPAFGDYTVRSASLQRDYRDETKLIWYFDLTNEDTYANVQMDAKTGLLLGFSLPQNDFENQSFTEEEAKTIAEEFLKTEASDVFSKTEYTKESSSYAPLAKEGELPSSYYITYQRMENGIPVNGNYLTVRVDADTKQVGYYGRSFTEGLTFPDISACMSEEEIFSVMDQKMNFTETFLSTEEGYSLAYTFLNPTSQAYDPYTGVILSYDGTAQAETVVPQYTDIQGHWAENMIVTLLDNGYYFFENEFRPDDVITKKEFMEFFRMIDNDSDEQIKKFIATVEGVSAEEADADCVMTKEVLSQYFIYRMNYQKIAAVDEIFCYPFPDTDEVDPSLKGDITILTGLGIFKGSSDGCFYPKKQLSRAEAASAVYHYLINAQ